MHDGLFRILMQISFLLRLLRLLALEKSFKQLSFNSDLKVMKRAVSCNR